MYYMCFVSNQLAVTNTNCQESNRILYWGINCTTPDPGYTWESDKLTFRRHKREPRGQPFLIRESICLIQHSDVKSIQNPEFRVHPENFLPSNLPIDALYTRNFVNCIFIVENFIFA